jgi:SAM-dependent methyltransferase
MSTRAGGGGTLSAKYCYGVWLRHLILAGQSGLSTTPEIVAELGPGESLGIGLAALLSGARAYYALDVIGYADAPKNLEVLNELVALLRNRAPVPDQLAIPGTEPALDSYAFPASILTHERLEAALHPARVQGIRRALAGLNTDGQPDGPVRYLTSWQQAGAIEEGTVDFLLSQAVLEHVDNLDDAYQAMHRWLKPGGVMSHQIDFRSHHLTKAWNGHWGIGDTPWTIIRGRRRYLLNRAPYATHVEHLRRLGFNVVREQRMYESNGLPRTRLAPRFRGISDEDLRTSAVLIQAIKS